MLGFAAAQFREKADEDHLANGTQSLKKAQLRFVHAGIFCLRYVPKAPVQVPRKVKQHDADEKAAERLAVYHLVQSFREHFQSHLLLFFRLARRTGDAAQHKRLQKHAYACNIKENAQHNELSLGVWHQRHDIAAQKRHHNAHKEQTPAAEREHAVAQARLHRVTEECLPLRVIQRNAAHRHAEKHKKCRHAVLAEQRHRAVSKIRRAQKQRQHERYRAARLRTVRKESHRNHTDARHHVRHHLHKADLRVRRAKIRRIQIVRQRVKRNGILQ